jgi:hypothetical protein
MKVVILYRPDSDHARAVEEFAHEFERIHGRSVDMVSVNTRDGAATASLYDIMQYPAVMATTDIGEMLQVWSGENLPLMNEVAAYSVG